MVSWAVQLLLASVVPLIALGAIESALNTQDTLAPQLLGYAFLAVVGTGLAFVVSALNRAWIEVGVWVWILPVIIEIWAAISEGSSTGGLASVGHLFLIPGPGRGEEGLGVVFFTYPTWSCCWYSAAMWWRLRRRRLSSRMIHQLLDDV
jgi:hypothetical protein